MGNQSVACNYVKIEFLTKEEYQNQYYAIEKEQLQEEEMKLDDFDIITNYQDLYKASFRDLVEIPQYQKQIFLQEITNFFQIEAINLDKYKDLAQFYKQNVQSFFIIMDQTEIKDQNFQIDLSKYQSTTPLIEFMYEPFSGLDKFQIQAKKVLNKVKTGLFSIFKGVFSITSFLSWNIGQIGFSMAIRMLLGNFPLGMLFFAAQSLLPFPIL